MSSIRQLSSRSRTWLALCLATVACNSIFDIQDPIEAPAPDGMACILNSNCPTGEVCLFRLCSPPCETDVDCSDTGSRCLQTDDGTACVSEAQASCGAEGAAACPSGTVCVDDSCYAACEGSGVCADGHACVDGACKGTVPNNTGGASGGGTSGQPLGGQSSSGEGGVATGGQALGGAGGEGGEAPVEICVPNARGCDDNQITSCNADGTAFLPPKACDAKQTCVAGACEAQECAPNTDFCSGNSVRTCAANGLSSQEQTACGAGRYCDSTTATCKSGVCAPNQPACDGNSATTCNATGSGYLVGATACKTTETCQGGTCIPQVCTPNGTSCQGQNIKKCAANGLSSSIDSTCGASKTCVESGATASCTGVCGPGQTNCSGNGVQPCSASGQWGTAVACATNQTCVAGLCTGCPSKTVNCDDNSVNGCEIDLTSTATCGTTCNNLVACSSQHGTASCSNGTCDVSSCSPSYDDCGGTNDGCETNLATSPDNCSACGKICSANHMATRTCSGAACNGTCAADYGDCDSNKQTNGCETPLVADANHCGNCTTVCKYRSCQGSVCVASTWGDNTVTAGPTTTKLVKDKLWAIKIQIAPQGVTTTLLQALGIVVVVNGSNPAANIRMGLYTDSGGGAPNALEAQTTAFVTANGVSERLLASPVSISTGAHWVAFVADQDVRVHADAATVTWISGSVTYAGLTTLPATFPVPSAFTVERGHLFAVTTP
jgi:hypothetical protein